MGRCLSIRSADPFQKNRPFRIFSRTSRRVLRSRPVKRYNNSTKGKTYMKSSAIRKSLRGNRQRWPRPGLRMLIGLIGLVTACSLVAQPTIGTHPQSTSVSLGATVVFTVAATTTSPPLSHQLQLAGRSPNRTMSQLAHCLPMETCWRPGCPGGSALLTCHRCQSRNSPPGNRTTSLYWKVRSTSAPRDCHPEAHGWPRTPLRIR